MPLNRHISSHFCKVGDFCDMGIKNGEATAINLLPCAAQTATISLNAFTNELSAAAVKPFIKLAVSAELFHVRYKGTYPLTASASRPRERLLNTICRGSEL